MGFECDSPSCSLLQCGWSTVHLFTVWRIVKLLLCSFGHCVAVPSCEVFDDPIASSVCQSFHCWVLSSHCSLCKKLHLPTRYQNFSVMSLNPTSLSFMHVNMNMYGLKMVFQEWGVFNMLMYMYSLHVSKEYPCIKFCSIPVCVSTSRRKICLLSICSLSHGENG